MRGDAEWGGQPELMALSWSRHLNIMVHQWKEPSYLVECGEATAPVIHLSYHDGNVRSTTRRVSKNRFLIS